IAPLCRDGDTVPDARVGRQHEEYTMPRMATTVHDRRTVVLAGALAGLAVLTGCSGDGPTDEEKTVTTSPMDSEEARAAAAALLEDAQVSLDAAFGGLIWEDSAPGRETPNDVGCRITLPTRRCDVYLGRESADHERIASALRAALGVRAGRAPAARRRRRAYVGPRTAPPTGRWEAWRGGRSPHPERLPAALPPALSPPPPPPPPPPPCVSAPVYGLLRF